MWILAAAVAMAAGGAIELILARRLYRKVQEAARDGEALVDAISDKYGEALSVVASVARIPDCAAPEIQRMCEDLLARHGVNAQITILGDESDRVH